MATYILTIAGTERHLAPESLSLNLVAVGRNVMSCTVKYDADDPTYVPAVGDAVTLTEDATEIFSGTIRSTQVVALGGQPVEAEIETHINCDGYDVLPERRFIGTLTIASGTTLKAACQQVDDGDYLNDFGIAFDAAMASGPTLSETIVADGMQLSSLFAKLSQLSSWLPEIGSSQWRFYDPSARAAPFNIATADDPAHYFGDIQITRTRDKFVNRVIAKGGQPPNRPTTDTFTGDGVTTTFTLTYPIAGPVAYTADGAVGQGFVAIDGLTDGALGGVSSGLAWTYDPSTQAITRAAGAPTNGATITIGYDVQYPITATVEDASDIALNGPYESVVPFTDVYDKALLTALAQAVLDDGVEVKIQAAFNTYETGVKPGQTLTIDHADRIGSTSFLISEVTASGSNALDCIVRSVKAVASTRFQGSYRDLIQAWLGGGGATSASTSTAGPSTSGSAGVPGNPDSSVQYNSGGKFAGNEHLEFDADTTSVLIGTGHTPGGADNLLVGQGHAVN